MYAIIQTGGKQYKVAEGDTILLKSSTLRLTARIRLTKYSRLAAKR